MAGGHRLSDGNFKILKRPFPHETDSRGIDPIDDELGVVDGPEIGTEQGIALPNGFKRRPVADEFRRAGDADLVMGIVEINTVPPAGSRRFPGSFRRNAGWRCK